ncbi:MAG: mercury resistance protein [Rhodanobacteraceae bacterium]|nr:MAG: mercury resistance protein [Rhodanobacteraceae bacterium]
MDESAEPVREVPRWRTYAWGVLAVVSCPCHLPLLAIALAGTSMGALLGKHGVIAALLLAALFLLALNRALKAFRDRA